ncbi:MAG: tRNA 2-thiouridine(34) synthase MnmA [Candidatus Dependentiae bacterium]
MERNMNIAVLVSGGVDSSVALRLLQEQGHNVTAFYLKIWLEDELAYLGDCPWEQDLSYVRKVCDQAKVNLEVVNLQREYFDHVVKYAIAETKAGKTPNPDVFCNVMIKFGFFIDYIDKTYPGKFDKIASGHYAQLTQKDDVFYLKKAPDTIKDQTYFLSHLKQDQLKRIVFPIGHLEKSEVRKLAQNYNLPNKDRKDSQGICFLGKLKFNEFLNHYLGEKPGDKVEYETGTILGQHKGFWYHTIGQRQGSGLSGGPWYVVDKDPIKNIVYFSRNYFAQDKKRNQLTVSDLNWFAGKAPEKTGLSVKLRHGPNMHSCTISAHHGDVGDVIVTLHENDQGIAPGQIAAFYDGDICLGAGIIKS